MQLKKGEIKEFDIHALAFGGAGVGKYEGMTVFVDRVMPGDRVKAAFTRIKPKFAEAKLIEIVKKSEERVETRCKYADFCGEDCGRDVGGEAIKTCGGCNFQFMPYEKQLEFKKQHVIDSFERIGKIYSPLVHDVIGYCGDGESEAEPFYYRNKMEFSFGYDEEMKFVLGMHVPGRKFDIMNLYECHLQSRFSYSIVNKVREFMHETRWKPFKYSIGKGFLKSLYIREGKRTDEVMVNFVTSDDMPENFDEKIKGFVEMLVGLSDPDGDKKITSIYWSQVISKRGHPRKVKETLLHGKRFLTEKMILENGDELVFDILPQSFFQVNTFQAEVLYHEVVKLVSQDAQGVVFDLFCGTGTIGLFCSKHCEQVLGIELNEESVKAARENAAKNKIFNVDFFTGDVAKLLHTMRERPSLIVVDPPRAGLTQKMIDKMNDFGAKEIVYVSCNPSTLARDCNLLGEYGYKVKSVQPVDMFPHTFHIECVCSLGR